MQSGVFETGLGRAAFLHASDVMRSLPTPEIAGDEEAPPSQPQPVPPISELLRDGQEIVVQVVKDPIGSKGPRLTTQISIPSRYLVLLPQSPPAGSRARTPEGATPARRKPRGG